MQGFFANLLIIVGEQTCNTSNVGKVNIISFKVQKRTFRKVKRRKQYYD